MTRRGWHAAALTIAVGASDVVTAAQATATTVIAPATTMNMAEVVALLQQQQREIAEQRERLDQQARKISVLTGELDALRGAPGVEATTPAVEPPEQLAEMTPGQGAADSEAPSALQTVSPARTEQSTKEATQNAVAEAQVDDPTQDLLSKFPGAWRLPGTTAALQVNGFVRTVVVANRDVLTIPDRFIVGSIPVQQGDTQENAAQSSITAKQSRLGFDYRDATDQGILRAFIDGDFTGDDNSFRLRNAFGQWRRTLAGQTWSAFVDTNATPEEVDFEGLNGRINVRQSQVRFSPRIGQDFELMLSLEDPNPQLQNGNGVTRLPDVVLAGIFQPNERLRLRTALLGRQIRGQEQITVGDNQEIEGGVEKAYAWGVSLSGSITTPRFDGRDKFQFQLNYGNGIGRYVNDLNSIGNYDGIFNPETGDLQLFNVFAGYGSLQHWWGATLRSNATFGWVTINNPGFIPGDAYKRTLRASVNLLWNPTPHVDTGVEYLWGSRENKSGDHGEAQQLQAMIRYMF